MFRTAGTEARRVTFEVADATLAETTEDLTLPVGYEGPITLAGMTANAAVSRGTDRQGTRVVEVAVTPGEWQGDRRFLYPAAAFLEDRRRGFSMSMAVGGPVKLSAADPAGDAPTVSVTGALVHVRGPWSLEVEVPDASAG